MTLAIPQQNHVLPWQETCDQATMLVRSGMLPTSVKTPEAALAIILKAREMGVGPMEGFEGISVIQGRPTVSPRLQLALIHRSGLLQAIDIQEDAHGCRVTMIRRGGSSFTTCFTLEDAKRAGLLQNDNWRKYPQNMCRWRAVGYCADVLFPDVTGGAYRPEEMGADVDANGDMLRPTVVSSPQAPPASILAAEVVEEVSAVEGSLPPSPTPPRATDPEALRRERAMAVYRQAVPGVWATKAQFVEFLSNSWGKDRLLDLTDEEVEDLEGAVQAYAAAQHVDTPAPAPAPAPAPRKTKGWKL